MRVKYTEYLVSLSIVAVTIGMFVGLVLANGYCCDHNAVESGMRNERGLSGLYLDYHKRVVGRKGSCYRGRRVGMSATAVEQADNAVADERIVTYFKNLQQGSDVRGVAMDGTLRIMHFLLLVNIIQPLSGVNCK